MKSEDEIRQQLNELSAAENFATSDEDGAYAVGAKDALNWALGKRIIAPADEVLCEE